MVRGRCKCDRVSSTTFFKISICLNFSHTSEEILPSSPICSDLRKIPGLTSHEKEEVKKINEKVHDRRLVEAVLARRGKCDHVIYDYEIS